VSGIALDCGCFIYPDGTRVWCPTCSDGGSKDTRDDTIRSLRLENGRLRWALADALWRWKQADPNNPQLPVDEAALSAPGDGLWQEVVWLLNVAGGVSDKLRDCQCADCRDWRKRRDALLGRKP